MYIYIQIVCNECEASINLQMSHLNCKILLKSISTAKLQPKLVPYSPTVVNASAHRSVRRQ